MYNEFKYEECEIKYKTTLINDRSYNDRFAFLIITLLIAI